MGMFNALSRRDSYHHEASPSKGARRDVTFLIYFYLRSCHVSKHRFSQNKRNKILLLLYCDTVFIAINQILYQSTRYLQLR